MTPQDRDELLATLKARFEQNMHRHSGIAWSVVQAKLDGHSIALQSLRAMEASGGEPDVIGADASFASSC